MPMSANSSAFWKCFRFSASSRTIEAGPSMTASVTSSPLTTGMQCMNFAPGFAFVHSASFTW